MPKMRVLGAVPVSIALVAPDALPHLMRAPEAQPQGADRIGADVAMPVPLEADEQVLPAGAPALKSPAPG
jgi:hypothetical protein